MKPRIVTAANRNKETGEIILGIRHFDPFMRAQIKDRLDKHWKQSEQGFVDQFGKFYSRQDAKIIAEENNQIIRRCGGDENRLFSENIH